MIEEVGYKIDIDVFQGPFDLLLQAIDDGNLNVNDISISKITSSYFEYWQREVPDLVLASDFLYMAAYLLELKTKSLLPAKEEILNDEAFLDVENSLVSHIQEYEVYKNLAQNLRQRKEKYERVYGRHEGEPQEREFELVDVSLKDLILAFKRVYDEAAKQEKVIPIKAEEVTLDERIIEIKKLILSQSEGVAFIDIFIRRTRLEIVVTFLAVLELAKQRFLKIMQDNRFGSIRLFARKEEEKNGTRESESSNPESGKPESIEQA